jgi:hypothetical protein
VNHGLNLLAGALADMAPPMGALLVGVLALYALLMAVPFVPGVEIGVMLIVLRGQDIVPEVYGCTVAGLLLAYAMGRLVPPQAIARGFASVGLSRASALVASTAPIDGPQRLAMLSARLPHGAAARLVRHRHVVIGLLLNLPGNALLGGGAGICLVAGLSRLVAPPAMAATVALAVAPVPLAVWWLGLPGFLR